MGCGDINVQGCVDMNVEGHSPGHSGVCVSVCCCIVDTGCQLIVCLSVLLQCECLR